MAHEEEERIEGHQGGTDNAHDHAGLRHSLTARVHPPGPDFSEVIGPHDPRDDSEQDAAEESENPERQDHATPVRRVVRADGRGGRRLVGIRRFVRPVGKRVGRALQRSGGAERAFRRRWHGGAERAFRRRRRHGGAERALRRRHGGRGGAAAPASGICTIAPHWGQRARFPACSSPTRSV